MIAKAKIFHLAMVLVMALALVAVSSPVVGLGVSSVQADNPYLEELQWFYDNDPLTEGGDGCREGGLGQTPGDLSDDGGGALESVPDGHGGTMLRWVFDGSAGISAPGCSMGADRSYFDIFLPLYGANWRNCWAIKFDVRVELSGTPPTRPYFRLYTGMDNNGDGIDFFNDDGCWSVNKLDVGHNGVRIPDNKHNWMGGCTDSGGGDMCVGLYCPNGYWPQPEFEAERTGWSTFQLRFDRVKDSRGGFWANPGEYDISNDWVYGLDVCGESREDRGIEPYDWHGIIERRNLESFRFFTYLYLDQWITSDGTITVYFDNIELIRIQGVPVFPNPYIGIAATIGAGVLAYLFYRRLRHQE